MKKIIFVRHGKAEEEASDLSDFERSLTTGGKKIAVRMARLFADKEKAPGTFITSPAFRAIETALIFAGESNIAFDKILIDSNLYFRTNLDRLLDILNSLDENIQSVTIFGHNPSFSDMADSLSRNGCDFIPKTGIACLSFEVDSWSGVRSGTGKVEYLMKPEKLL
jgi:phosphohistidine phosphatase